ncbi:hypothetical protein R0K18_35280, partial [Pantoea sp. SIMBA_133]
VDNPLQPKESSLKLGLMLHFHISDDVDRVGRLQILIIDLIVMAWAQEEKIRRFTQFLVRKVVISSSGSRHDAIDVRNLA